MAARGIVAAPGVDTYGRMLPVEDLLAPGDTVVRLPGDGMGDLINKKPVSSPATQDPKQGFEWKPVYWVYVAVVAVVLYMLQKK